MAGAWTDDEETGTDQQRPQDDEPDIEAADELAEGGDDAWPALGNYRVWRGGQEEYYRIWLDDTKPPFKKA